MPETTFNEAAESVKNLKTKPTSDELLKLYSLYKQATVGDCTGDRPGMFDVKGRHKYDRWHELKGMSSEEAQSQYIAHAKELLTKYA